MASIALSVASVTINNVALAIVPNSLTYDAGEGEVNVRSAMAGNRAVSVHTINAETRISKVSFELYNTTELDGQISEWKQAVGGNFISFVATVNGSPVTRSFPGMSLMNAVERTISADGTVSLEWSGDPMTGA